MASKSTNSKTHPLVYLARFAAGRPMDGVRRTNATFLRRADTDLTSHKRSAHWHWLPGWHRAAWRIGTTAGALGFAYGYVTARTATLAAGLAAAITALILTGIWGHLRIRDWHLDRKIGRPLFMTAAMITGHDLTDNHRKHLSIPRNYAKDPKARIVLKLPYTFEGKAQDTKRLHDLVMRRLGGEWDMMPHFSAHPPHLEFFPSPAPPGSVSFADILPYLEKSDSNSVVLGIGTHAALASINLDSESPHVAVTMGTGGGKSSLLRLIVAQLIRHGVQRIDIIDPKRISHDWARNIPGVYIHRSMAEQIKAVHAFRTEMELRYDTLEQESRAGLPLTEFPRHVLIIEEQNSWINYARQYWKDYRNELSSAERGRVPADPPVIGDLGFILFQGRQSRMNVFSVFQRMSAAASGGGDMRENYYAKLLARFSPQTWKILVGTTPVPRSSKINGRAKFVLGEDDKWIQLAFITEREAQEYAALGNVLAETGPDDSPDPDDPVTLREAADANVIPLSYAALRRARNRDAARFPTAVASAAGNAYRPSDLRAWYESRPGRRGLARAA
jgi:hypothetical protein